jgi:hypothetical protein
LWAENSAHMSSIPIARPHTSNPHLATFFASQNAAQMMRDEGATPETVPPTGEVMWTHDDNVYDLRQVVEEQRDRITKLENQVADLLVLLQQQKIVVPQPPLTTRRSVPSVTPVAPSMPNKEQTAPRISEVMSLVNPVTIADTDTVVLDFLSPVKTSLTPQTTPVPVAREGIISPLGATATSQSTNPSYSMSPVTGGAPTTKGDSFGVDAKWFSLLQQCGMRADSPTVSKSAFRVMFRSMEVIGAPISDRRLESLLSKYKSAGRDVLTAQEFAVLYLRLVEM